MDVIAVILATVLLIVAIVHFAWAFGSNWPVADQQTLSNTVVGTPGATAMPPKPLTFMVALLVAFAALWPLFWQALIPYPHWVPQTLIWLGMWSLTLVFLLRGAGGLLPLAASTVQPFRRLNKLYYSPLCLLLGAGFLTLVLNP